MTGRWPRHQIDHRDLNKSNNRWSNLRQASSSQNGANRKGKSPLKGVIDLGPYSTKRFQAMIQVNGKRHYLGRFSNARQAYAAYRAAARKHFGEYARAA
jgi:HNH endonuclease